MLFKRDFSNAQFVELEKLYSDAEIRIQELKKNYPENKDIWETVERKMKIIKLTLDDTSAIPSDDRKREADMSTMLNYQLRDFPDELLRPFYQLDNAYTLLTLKDINFENSGANLRK